MAKYPRSPSANNNRHTSLLVYLGVTMPPARASKRPLIGVIEGSGIGPEVIAAALRVLAAVEQVTGLKCELRHGGVIGEEAEKHFGSSLPESTAHFYTEIFSRGGAILNGPGGGRFVYDLRKRFDLFCKFVPVRSCPQLARNAPSIASNNLHPIDMLIVRDNIAGAYQGNWSVRESESGKIAEHTFSYNSRQIQRLANVAARAAAARRGKIHVIVKDGGLPAVTSLWREVSVAEAAKRNVEAIFVNVDLAAYEFIRNPAQFDVVLTPNLFGDILVDITGALLGSRGVTFSGNYDGVGNAVYQTNHGCAHDLAGADVANPGGQILSLAMMLRESFGQGHAATLMENALAAAWQDGWRTADVAEPGCRVVGTHAMAEQVANHVLRFAEKPKNEIRVAAD
jgi:3-isopropylmalate dehydrogenase